jgi:uncharacterized membrane protein YgdD (TMEM256/DUF423 family)
MDVCKNSGNRWIVVGTILAGLAVMTGAFAAHRLDQFLVEKYDGVEKVIVGEKVSGARKYLADFKTAAEYQMYHGLGLLCLGISFPRLSRRAAGWAGQSLLWGTVLFSGSLYLLVLTGITKLGAITPIGGVLFLVGWLAFGWAAWQGNSPSSQ